MALAFLVVHCYPRDVDDTDIVGSAPAPPPRTADFAAGGDVCLAVTASDSGDGTAVK